MWVSPHKLFLYRSIEKQFKIVFEPDRLIFGLQMKKIIKHNFMCLVMYGEGQEGTLS